MVDYLHTAFRDHLNQSDELQDAMTHATISLPDLFSSRYAQPLPDSDLFLATEQHTHATDSNPDDLSSMPFQEISFPAGKTQAQARDAKPANVLNIFISYVKEDRKILESLQKHLRVMQRQLERRNRTITIWHSGQVVPGQDWKEKIEQYLSTAHIILLLVSIDFLDSELCYAIQIQPALDRHNCGKACVIPVILRPCTWEEELFGTLQPLPTDGVPIISWPIPDEAYNDIIRGIRQAISDLSL
jgi:hypothetical protein